MSKLEELEAAIAEFEKAQAKYARFGAQDTEPDAVFQARLVRAAKGGNVRIPTDPEGWELYSDMRGAQVAADALFMACLKCVEVIEETPLGESQAVVKYLVDYCWRVDF